MPAAKHLDRTSGHPLYLQLKELLIQQISAGDMEPDGRLPSEERLARIYGLSRMTARQALKALAREVPLISTRGRGTYLASAPGGGQRRKLEYIRFIYPNDKQNLRWGSFYFSIFQAVEEEAAKSGHDVIFTSLTSQGPALANIRGNEGVIVVGITHKKVLARLTKKDVPLCLLDSGTGDEVAGTLSLQVDSYGGARLAVDHLTEMGHTSIALVTSTEPESPAFQGRRRGYTDALHENGLQVSSQLIQRIPWSMKPEEGRRAVHRLMAREDPPTAVFAAGDSFAHMVLGAARAEGLRVPDDLSIVGFGDDIESRRSYPRLSSVRVFGEKMGRLAVKFLIERSMEPQMASRKRVVPAELVRRGSVARLK